MNASADPLRRLAQERGRILAELGVRPADEGWAKREAEALASLLTPSLRAGLPRPFFRLIRRMRRLCG